MATESLQEVMNDFNNEVAFLRFFYERAGEMMGPADCGIYRMIADDFARHDGLFTADDLRDYPVVEEKSIWSQYQGLDVGTVPAPSSGPQLIQMLKILEHFDLGALGHNTPAYIDLFARVQRAS